MLAELFTSNTRAEIMRILFDGEGREYYLRDIEKKLTFKLIHYKRK